MTRGARLITVLSACALVGGLACTMGNSQFDNKGRGEGEGDDAGTEEEEEEEEGESEESVGEEAADETAGAASEAPDTSADDSPVECEAIEAYNDCVLALGCEPLMVGGLIPAGAEGYCIEPAEYIECRFVEDCIEGGEPFWCSQNAEEVIHYPSCVPAEAPDEGFPCGPAGEDPGPC